VHQDAVAGGGTLLSERVALVPGDAGVDRHTGHALGHGYRPAAPEQRAAVGRRAGTGGRIGEGIGRGGPGGIGGGVVHRIAVVIRTCDHGPILRPCPHHARTAIPCEWSAVSALGWCAWLIRLWK